MSPLLSPSFVLLPFVRGSNKFLVILSCVYVKRFLALSFFQFQVILFCMLLFQINTFHSILGVIVLGNFKIIVKFWNSIILDDDIKE